MTHDVTISTTGELLVKLAEYGKQQGAFSLTLVLDEAGDYSSMFNFGFEADDSPMVAGSSLGYGRSLEECLRQMCRECHLLPSV
jgi:hypothetical protein